MQSVTAARFGCGPFERKATQCETLADDAALGGNQECLGETVQKFNPVQTSADVTIITNSGVGA